MIKREAKFGIIFRHWLRGNPQLTGAYELKDTRGKDYLQFSEVKDTQLDYGLAIRSDRGALIRIMGGNSEPDYVYLRSVPSYIVVRYPRSFYIIPTDRFYDEKLTSKAKSLSEQRASAICLRRVPLSRREL